MCSSDLLLPQSLQPEKHCPATCAPPPSPTAQASRQAQLRHGQRQASPPAQLLQSRPPQLCSGRCERWERPELGDMGGQTKPMWQVLANCRIKWYKSLQPHLPEKTIAGAALPPPPGRPPDHSRQQDSGCLGPQSGSSRAGSLAPCGRGLPRASSKRGLGGGLLPIPARPSVWEKTGQGTSGIDGNAAGTGGIPGPLGLMGESG